MILVGLIARAYVFICAMLAPNVKLAQAITPTWLNVFSWAAAGVAASPRMVRTKNEASVGVRIGSQG